MTLNGVAASIQSARRKTGEKMVTSMPPPDDDQPMGGSVFFYRGTSDFYGVFKPHRHRWGQINCVFSGVGSFASAGKRLIGVPGVGIWFPPGCVHECYNHHQMVFNVMNVTRELCGSMPQDACMIGLTDIFQTIFADFFNRGLQLPTAVEDLRLAHVLLDQIRQAPAQDFSLPTVDDPVLEPIIKHYEQNPGDNTSLAVWAKQLFSTERTINRKFQRALGMSFRDWRMRLRFLHAISLLHQGITIEEIAFSVGYSSSSAFINMFSKFAHTSPQRYRENLRNPSVTP